MTEDGRAVVAKVRERVIAVGWSETARRSGYDRAAIWRALTRPSGTGHTALLFCVAQAVGVRITAE